LRLWHYLVAWDLSLSSSRLKLVTAPFVL
jgi:hypothetical protein